TQRLFQLHRSAQPGRQVPCPRLQRRGCPQIAGAKLPAHLRRGLGKLAPITCQFRESETQATAVVACVSVCPNTPEIRLSTVKSCVRKCGIQSTVGPASILEG